MRLKRFVLNLTSALFIVTFAHASDVQLPPDEYSIQSWDERHGLPSGRIWAITQDSIGYLWLGTEAGLVRFDGVRFTDWTSDDGTPLPKELSVSSLYSATDGSLWLGFHSGGVGRIQEGRLHRYSRLPEIGSSPVNFLLEDRTGTVWAGDRHAVYLFRNGRWDIAGASSGLPEADGGSGGYEDKAGNLWIGTRKGIFRRPSGNTTFVAVDDGKHAVRVQFSEDATGSVWVTDPLEGYVQLGSSGNSRSAVRSGTGQDLIHDRNDTMWLGTRGEGLWRVRLDSRSHDPVIERITVVEGLSSNIVRSVFEDRNGNVWVGTESALHRFTARKVTPLQDVNLSWATAATPDGSVWIATNDGLVQFIGQYQRRFGHRDGLPGSIVKALFTDARGTLWVATDRGVARWVGDRFKQIPIASEQPASVVSLAADSRGRLWVSDRERGVLLLTNDKWTTVPTPPDIADAEANFVYVDRRDRLWIGFSGATVAVVEPEGKVRLHPLKGVIGSVLSAVYEDREGAIWIGGMRGLSRIKGDTVDVVSQPNDLPGHGVFGITEDQEGSLWLGVGSGIVRLSVSDFEKAARQPRDRPAYRLYDASDGLVGVPARLGFPGATRRGDGTLWFITSRGASVIRPDDLDNRDVPPAVRIQGVWADDQPVRLRAGAALPPGTSRLLFEYTAVNLTSPLKERFQYRLEGIDSDWVVAGSRREAFYPNLRSGTYRFRVARIASDQFSNEPAIWEFSIRPMYYETWWFMWGCAAAAGLAGWGAWRLRLRQLRRQFTLVFAERARMSRELHDTLLQDLVGITLHLDEFAATLGSRSGRVRARVVHLRRYLERAIGEARQAVWDLRSEHTGERDLPRELFESGERAFASRPTHFETIVKGTPRPCGPAVECHLLRIAREALCNAARHADATSVALTLDYRQDDIVLRVSDNGRGCQTADYSGHAPGHYGFLIMKERAEQAGGRFRVETTPGKGTEIEVTIPLT